MESRAANEAGGNSVLDSPIPASTPEMSSSSSPSSSTPPSPSSSVATTIEQTSPPLANLSLKDVTEEDKKAAAEFKQQANKAFGGAPPSTARSDLN